MVTAQPWSKPSPEPAPKAIEAKTFDRNSRPRRQIEAEQAYFEAAQNQQAGEYDQAETLYQRSLALLETKLGKDHLDVATCLHNLGVLYQDQAEYGKAEVFIQRTL